MRIANLIAGALVASLASVAGATHLVTSEPSAIRLEGSSNLAPWQCSGTTIEGTLVVDAPLARINDVIDRIENGNIGEWMSNPLEGRFPSPEFGMTIPIESLRCGNAVMERDLRRALRSDSHPAIEFRLTEIRAAIRHDVDRGDYETRIAGELTLAGTRRTIEVNVVARRLARHRFHLRAELPLRMSEFGITPPTALFGMIRANDPLVARFDLTVVAWPGGGRP